MTAPQPRLGFEVMLTLPEDAQVLSLDKRNGVVCAVTTCGTFEWIGGHFVLITPEEPPSS